MKWFKNLDKRKTAVMLVLVVLALAGTWYFQGGTGMVSGNSSTAGKVTWPTSFPETKDSAPSVVVQVDPDFGYRTGDVIPVTIFVRENAGTEVDISGLALEGDFEIRGEPVLTRKSLGEGAQGYCLQLQLQSFSIQPKLSSMVSFTWNVRGQRQWKEVKAPLVDVFTSLTWDGLRKEIQPGPMTAITNNHLYVSIGMLAGSVLLFIGCIVFQRYYHRLNAASEERRQASPRMVCKRRVDAARKAIEAGDTSKENFRIIAEAVRTYLGLDSVLLSGVPEALGHNPYKKRIQASINLCERVVYRDEEVTLNDGELRYLWVFLDDILLRRNPEAEQDPDFILNRPRAVPKPRSGGRGGVGGNAAR